MCLLVCDMSHTVAVVKSHPWLSTSESIFLAQLHDLVYKIDHTPAVRHFQLYSAAWPSAHWWAHFLAEYLLLLHKYLHVSLKMRTSHTPWNRGLQNLAVNQFGGRSQPCLLWMANVINLTSIVFSDLVTVKIPLVQLYVTTEFRTELIIKTVQLVTYKSDVQS